MNQQPTEAALKSMGLLPDDYSTVANTTIIQGLDHTGDTAAVPQQSITVDIGDSFSEESDVPDVPAQALASQDLECPTWLTPKGSKFEVQLYSAKCLKCAWLIETPTSVEHRKDAPQCHVTFGNSRCSAAAISIKLTGKNEDKVQRLSIALLMAREAKDPGKVKLALQRISEESEEVQFKVFEKVNLV